MYAGASAMPKAYWVTAYRAIKNPDAFAAYAKLAAPAVHAAGGRFLVRGTPAKIYEAGLNARTVVVEFESLEQALMAYESEGYKAALKALGTGNVERDMRVVAGAE